jgi:hypothetical protein
MRVLEANRRWDPDPGQALDPVPLVVQSHAGQVKPQGMGEFRREVEAGRDVPFEVPHRDSSPVKIDVAGPQVGGRISGEITRFGQMTQEIPRPSLNGPNGSGLPGAVRG